MNKERITITIDEQLLNKIDKIVNKKTIYRNRSHWIEQAIRKYIKNEK